MNKMTELDALALIDRNVSNSVSLASSLELSGIKCYKMSTLEEVKENCYRFGYALVDMSTPEFADIVELLLTEHKTVVGWTAQSIWNKDKIIAQFGLADILYKPVEEEVLLAALGMK